MPRLPPRTVVRHYFFQRNLAALIPDEAEANAFIQAAEYVLAHDPTAGIQIDADVWYLPMALVASEQVALYYQFDDKTVRLRAIKAIPTKTED